VDEVVEAGEEEEDEDVAKIFITCFKIFMIL
jgi:hypothetical protein